MILTCVFSMLTLITSMVCSSLIFYNEKTRTEINSEKVLKMNDKYKSSSIIYYQSNNLDINNIKPSFKKEQTFSITNNNSDTILYNIEWSNISSNWNDNDEFVYSISCSNGERVENKRLPVTNNDNVIIEDIELKTNTTNTCKIVIEFKSVEGQVYNESNSFKGTYQVIIEE